MKLTTPVSITEQHIDEYGHVNYRAFPEIFESGQDHLMEVVGFSFKDIQEKFGLRSFVKVMGILYHQQLLKDDIAAMHTEPHDVGISSISFKQRIVNVHLLVVAELELVVVLVDANGKKATIPEELKAALQTH